MISKSDLCGACRVEFCSCGLHKNRQECNAQSYCIHDELLSQINSPTKSKGELIGDGLTSFDNQSLEKKDTSKSPVLCLDVRQDDEGVCECGHPKKRHTFGESFCYYSEYCPCKKFREVKS